MENTNSIFTLNDYSIFKIQTADRTRFVIAKDIIEVCSQKLLLEDIESIEKLSASPILLHKRVISESLISLAERMQSPEYPFHAAIIESSKPLVS